MRRTAAWGCALLLLAAAGCGPDVRVGSKAFTESVILGELARLKGDTEETPVAHLKEIGGTQFLWRGLLRGDIDAYPDYTGTIAEDILAGRDLPDREQQRFAAIKAALAEQNVEMTGPLGFNNTYAIGMKKSRAEELGIRTISDLAAHPDLRFGFSPEFMQRDDGWPGLVAHYGLPFDRGNARGVQHTLAYEALDQGDIDAMDLYSTDPKIKQLGIRILADDRGFFPKYNAVFVYRADLRERAPQLVSAMEGFSGAIDESTMIELNGRVELERNHEVVVAGAFLGTSVVEPTLLRRLLRSTLEHLYLVVVSLTAAICVSVPLGVIAAKRPRSEQAILVVAEVIQTIPGLALLVILMFPIGEIGSFMASIGLPKLRTIGPAPAIVALFMYSLLPIIRNTHAGITGIPSNLRESAEAIGLSPWAQLWQIELPMASRTILAGIKTTAVINVGYATLGGLIGAGGYGQVIMEGLRKLDFAIMMEGAIPSAILALLVKSLFEWGERFVVPQGLRLKASH